MLDDGSPPPAPLRIGDIAPSFSFTILECTSAPDPAVFTKLCTFARDAAGRSRAHLRARIIGELDGSLDQDLLTATGIDGVYGVVREATRRPDWLISAYLDDVNNIVNELVIIAWRGRFAALRGGEVITAKALDRWLLRAEVPFRLLPISVLAGVFPGDVRMMWTRGIHRPRTTKADTVAKGGIRLQDESNPLEAASYALSAASTTYDPEDDAAFVRGRITFSPERSTVYWPQRFDLIGAMRGLVEIFETVDKALVAESPPDPVLPDLAVHEPDLSCVRGAFDVSVITTLDRPLEEYTTEHIDEIELLSGSIICVTGDDQSSDFILDVGFDGSVAGQLRVRPVKQADRVTLDIRPHGTPSAESIVRRIKEVLGTGELLNVYYESGHAFTGKQIYRRNFSGAPFRGYKFADFSPYKITKEKPALIENKTIHELIREGGDDSLFAWVVDHFTEGELICDDGPGEIADFFHIANNGTLTAVHVKAAANDSSNRHISLIQYEQVVSQAIKNIRALGDDELAARLSVPRMTKPACWSNGSRVQDRSEFIEALRQRVPSDRTYVMVVQPHLRESVLVEARQAVTSASLTSTSRRLHLLDDLLNSTRANVVSHCDDLIVMGCADSSAGESAT